MKKRKKLPMSRSKHLFERGAVRTEVRNIRHLPMRGGIRL